MIVHNNTTLTAEAILQLTPIGKTISTWRQRRITLYEHPEDPERVISVGTTFKHDRTVIADELRSQWTAALAAIAQGKIHVSA